VNESSSSFIISALVITGSGDICRGSMAVRSIPAQQL